MKAFMKTTIAATLLATSAYASTAEAQQKIGYIDVQGVFQQLPQVAEISNQVQEEFASRRAELQKMETEMQSMSEKMQRDQQIMSASERRDLERELELMQTQYQMKARAFQEDNELRLREERNNVMRDILMTSQKVAQAEGYDMVLNSQAVMYAGEESDLTDEVVAAMNGGN